MSIEKFEIDNLGDYLAQRGGVDMTVPQSGAPTPGENAPSLLANRLKQDGMTLPMAKNDIGSLVSQKPTMPLPGRKMGG